MLELAESNIVSTHPDVAALVTPLSASRIEEVFIFIFLTLFPDSPERGWSSEA
jgi:DNA-binding GntR family transcriptional regulator